MKIKELIVRKTKPSEEIIREIIFNEKGLSLIIDDTPKDMRESGNSVGKSTAIKIIDLCLGAKSTRACLKIKNCTKHVFLSPFHDRIKKKGAFICQDVMN